MCNIKLIKGDCLERMDKLIKKGIKFDAIITDLLMGLQRVSGMKLFLLMKCGQD